MLAHYANNKGITAMKTLHQSLLGTGMVAALLAFTHASLAETIEEAVTPPASAQSQLALEEVIVTARKRAEELQDTPVAISAFSAESMKIAGIANTRDLQESVPGLNFSEMGNKSPSIFIRGVGQKESSAVLDPGVGVYINGIYIARTDSQLLDVIDVSSIQVLRGPQGTLYGSGSLAGNVRYIMNRPDPKEFEGSASVNFGMTEGSDGYNFNPDLMLNVPLTETAAFRINAGMIDNDGIVDYPNVYRTDANGDKITGNWSAL